MLSVTVVCTIRSALRRSSSMSKHVDTLYGGKDTAQELVRDPGNIQCAIKALSLCSIAQDLGRLQEIEHFGSGTVKPWNCRDGTSLFALTAETTSASVQSRKCHLIIPSEQCVRGGRCTFSFSLVFPATCRPWQIMCSRVLKRYGVLDRRRTRPTLNLPVKSFFFCEIWGRESSLSDDFILHFAFSDHAEESLSPATVLSNL
jgi:hypothetical protein